MSISTRLLGLCALLITAALLSVPAAAQAPTVQWNRTYSSNGAHERLSKLLPTPDGGYLLGGTSTSTISGGSKSEPSRGGADFWIIKVNAAGVKEWDRSLGGSAADYLYALVLTPDGGCIAAGSSASGISGDKTQPNVGGNDYWLVKLNAAGQKQWDWTIGSTGEESLSQIQFTTDGGYILGGSSSAGVGGAKTQPSRGGYDFWAVKLNANGTKLWDRTLGGSGVDALSELLPTADGGYLLAGTSDSNISGEKSAVTLGLKDFWVVKLDANGNKLWDKTYGGPILDYLVALTASPDGGFLLGGNSNGGPGGTKTQPGYSTATPDYWLQKIDANGTPLWDKVIGSFGEDIMSTMQTTPDGGYLLGGSSRSDISGDKTETYVWLEDYWAVKVDAAGNKQWDKTLGTYNEDYLNAVAATADNGFILGGSTQVPSTQGNPSGNQSFWVVKLNPVTPTATSAAAAHQPLGVYPNPAHQILTLYLADTAPRAGLQLTLLDATGRAVLTQLLPASANREVPVQVGSQPAGLYLLRLSGPNGYIATQRLELR